MSQLLFGPLAEFYFQLEKREQRLGSDVDVLADFFQTLARSKVVEDHQKIHLLDLGCGTGEHAAALHKRGFAITGLDLAPRMLAVAAHRFSKDQYPDLNFLEGDFRKDQALRNFAGAYSLFGSFNYLHKLQDLKSALGRTYQALQPGGLFIIEFWQREPYDGLPYRFTTDWQELIQDNVQIRRRRSLRREQDHDGDLLTILYEYNLQNIKGLKDGTYTEQHQFRLLDRTTLQTLCRAAGFDIQSERSKLGQAGLRRNSGSLIFILKKNV